MTEPGPAEAGELQPSRFAWRYLDQEQARELWDELIDWTAWLRERYELDTKVPPCWYRHGPVVEELTALMVAWTDAYYRGDEYRDELTAWHTQWFWPVIGRIRTITDFETCTHERCTAAPRTPTTLDGLDEFTAANVADRPEPETPQSEAQVADLSAAHEVRSIPEADMETAIDSGLAVALDPADPDSSVTFESVTWTYDALVGAWVPAA
jgi:hypothetical protein